MKKALAILLIPVFLITAAMGVTVTVYSCKGMSTATEKVVMAKPCCKDVGEKGCCNKESQTLKIKDDFVKAVHKSDLSSLHLIQVKEFQVSFTPLFSENSTPKSYWDKAPPLSDEQLYILYHSLII